MVAALYWAVTAPLQEGGLQSRKAFRCSLSPALGGSFFRQEEEKPMPEPLCTH